MIFATIVFLTGLARADDVSARSDARHGTYQGACVTSDDETGTQTLDFDHDGLILSHQMPRTAGSSEPGRVWRVRYPNALIQIASEDPACLNVRTSPTNAHPTARVCFAFDAETGRPSVVVEGFSRGLDCAKSVMTQTVPANSRVYNSYRPTTLRYDDTPLFGDDFKIPFAPDADLEQREAARLLRDQEMVRRVRAMNGASLDGFHRIMNESRAVHSYVAPTEETKDTWLNTTKLAWAWDAIKDGKITPKKRMLDEVTRGFLGADRSEMYARWSFILERGLKDPDPGIRAHALDRIALYVHIPSAAAAVLKQLREPSGDIDELYAALGAAEGLLEPMNEFVPHPDRLYSRFGTTSLPLIHDRTVGLIDAADFAAVLATEIFDLPGQPWTRVGRDDLLDALTKVAEEFRYPERLRRRAAEITVRNAPAEIGLADYLRRQLHSTTTTDGEKSSAAILYRMADYEREILRDRMLGMRENDEAPVVLRDKADHILQMLREKPSPFAVRCARALGGEDGDGD